MSAFHIKKKKKLMTIYYSWGKKKRQGCRTATQNTPKETQSVPFCTGEWDVFTMSISVRGGKTLIFITHFTKRGEN